MMVGNFDGLLEGKLDEAADGLKEGRIDGFKLGMDLDG